LALTPGIILEDNSPCPALASATYATAFPVTFIFATAFPVNAICAYYVRQLGAYLSAPSLSTTVPQKDSNRKMFDRIPQMQAMPVCKESSRHDDNSGLSLL
jgi:hypothetical protein